MFQGFSPETIEFMWGIRFNNEKTWFEAHKQIYLDTLYNPMKELCDQVYAVLNQEYPQYGLIHKVSRIYRDARRLHGRGPYKDHLWCSVEKPNDNFSAQPVLWFELTPDGWSYGMGYYAARALTMEKHRARIDRDPKPMKKLVRLLNQQSEFVLEGPAYKKEKPTPDRLLTEWYNKKSFTLSHDEELTEAIYQPELVDRLVEGYRFLMPFYDYFVTLDSDPDPRP